MQSIPKNCIKYEYLFSQNDWTKKFKEEEFVWKIQQTQKINIGTESYPKYVNLGINCTPK
jgi:hypothetical protein